jgi:hypothetical protein
MQPDRSAEFAECRSLGHSWKHRGKYGVDDMPADKRITRPFGWSTGCVGYHSRCLVCKTDRIKWITRSGEVISRYIHPDGYSQHGEDRLTSMEWRRTFVAVVFEEFSHSDQHQQAS